MKNEFNSDPSVLIFNNNQVTETPNQKHLGLFLDEKLNFGEHLRHVANKFNTSFGLLQKLGLESLQHRRWFCKLCTFYKIFKNHSPRL